MFNKKIKFLLITTFVFSILIFSANLCVAQELTSPCNGGDPDVDCPIDSGTIVLVTATLIYGFKKINKLKY